MVTSRNNNMLVSFMKSSTLNRHIIAYNKGKTRPPPIGDYPPLVPNKIMYDVPIYSCISSMQSVHIVSHSSRNVPKIKYKTDRKKTFIIYT